MDVPLLHASDECYRLIYEIGKKIPKRDRYGLWNEIEKFMLDFYTYIIRAAFSEKSKKFEPLSEARITLEIMKRLVRTAQGLFIIEEAHYLLLSEKFQHLSKMTNGWIAYVNK